MTTEKCVITMKIKWRNFIKMKIFIFINELDENAFLSLW